MQKAHLQLIDEELKPSDAPVPVKVEGRRLSSALSFVLQEVQRELSHDGLRELKGEVGEWPSLMELVQSTAERLGLELSAFERDLIVQELEKDERPFGVLQELVDDPQVSDIIVFDASRVTVQYGRRSLSTSVSFPSQSAYEAFVERLVFRAGASYSTKKPIADGMIGSDARIHVVHRSLCESGPYLTIRINRFRSVTANDLVGVGLAPRGIMDYLTRVVRCGQTLLIVGEVATGKTTLARAIASAIPREESILVIEDTPEIKLEHPQVRYLTTREANTDGEGRISPGACIRAGMRMAMNRIVFGEIRDAEAAESFVDVCSSGHPGLSTIHARNGAEAITRLELFLGRAQRGAAREVILKQVSTAVQVIVFLNTCADTGKRRVMEVIEIGGAADATLRQRELFRYEMCEGRPSWKVANRVSMFRELIERDVGGGPGGVVLSDLPSRLHLEG